MKHLSPLPPFSILAQTLKGCEVSSLDDLVDKLKCAPIQPKPNVKVLYFISDWKKFIEPKLSRERLSNHSGYHCFKISHEEEGKVCFRGKVLSTDAEWFPKQGVKLLTDDAKLDDKIEASEFRFDNIRMKKILDDVQSKYLPMLDTKKRKETEASWLALESTFQRLEKERPLLKTLSLSDLPKYRSPLPPDSGMLVTKSYNNTTTMWGTFHQEEVVEGNILTDAKIGLDVVIYNENDKASRPWLGVIKEIHGTEQMFRVQWYKRSPGGGVRFRQDLRDGKAYVSDVPVASVMLYSVADQLPNGDLDISDMIDRIMETYAEHDECYT